MGDTHRGGDRVRWRLRRYCGRTFPRILACHLVRLLSTFSTRHRAGNDVGSNDYTSRDIWMGNCSKENERNTNLCVRIHGLLAGRSSNSLSTQLSVAPTSVWTVHLYCWRHIFILFFFYKFSFFSFPPSSFILLCFPRFNFSTGKYSIRCLY